jgi:peptide/nickel transport system substrate-binding protein
MIRSRLLATVFVVILAIALPASLFATGAQEEEVSTIDFALSGNPDTLDPHATSGTLTFQVIRSFYDTLIEPNTEGRLVPALAESWSVSDDNLTWTFTLRDGVTFHNGDELTSADVKATLQRVMAEETSSPKASEFEAIQEIETPDDRTVVLRLDQPHAPLLSTLASGWGAILPKSLIDSGHDFANEPVGSGPFVFQEWIRDNRITMDANQDYWMDGLPRVGRVVINIIVEPAVQVQGLLAGQLDIIDTVPSEDVEQVRENEETKVQRDLSSLVMVLALNTDRAPLDQVAVRQAIAQSIDKQAALNTAYGGGEPVSTFMDYSDPYYVDFSNILPYDPEAARRKLEEAGVDLDEPLTMALPQNYEAHVQAGQVYEDMLSDIGLTIDLQLVDWSTWLSDVYRGGNYDLTVIGHTGKLDPDGRLSGYGTGESYVGWENERAASLIEEARTVVEFEERKELYAEVLELMAREVPHVYVGSNYRYIGLRSNVEGFHMDAKLDTFDFRRVTKN